MNDLLSFSDSTPSSSNHSNSNSLNRSFVNSSIYAPSDYFVYNINSIGDGPRSKKRSKSLISNYREFFDENLKKLKDELIDAKKIIKEKDEIIYKLNDVRDKLENEIRELTACLFEQAHAMVHEAKDETAQSNKLLNEANGKIDVLEAEVQALKALVLTSTPSEPNKHLHPHLSNSTKYSTNFLQVNQNSMTNSTSSNNIQQTPNKNLKSAHKRTPSYNDVAKNYQLNFKNPEDNVLTNAKVDENTILKYEIYEIDPIYFKEIVLWREVPNIDLNNSFISRVYNEDIIPCINFNNKELSNELLNSMKLNSVCIEDISNSHPIDTMQVCSLSNVPSICQYKIKINDSSASQWYFISKLCRNRITSVCDFFTYLRYIRDGLVKSDNRDVYWTIIELRKRMCVSRLGL